VEEARRASVAAQGEVTTGESDVAAARAEVAEAESRLGATRAALAQAETQVRVAESRFQRQDALFKEELTSRQDWEQAQADLERARADVDAARANLTQAQAQIDTAQARLRAAEGKLAEATKRAEIAARSLTREEAVLKGGYITGKEIVEAEAALASAELDRHAAAQSVRLLGGTPGGGTAPGRLPLRISAKSYVALRATANSYHPGEVPLVTPIAGRVQERNVSLGETVDTEHPLFTVINLDTVWAQLAVMPKDLPRTRLGQRVELTAESAPGRVFTGTVSAIGSVADEQTRAVRVRCALANRNGSLRPGTFVRGVIITDVRRERVTVPVGAIQEHNGKPTVYVTVAGKATEYEVRHVTLGVSGDGWREIASGLEAGEHVAAKGTFYLKSEALKSALSDGCCAVPGDQPRVSTRGKADP
jgi:cobalt-zinc-cadmium efflux system membrane fusion protein